MGISKAAIYSSAVILALFMGGPVQAQGTPKGASAAAPGQLLTKPPTPGSFGAKGDAPGQKADGRANEIAPGYLNPNKELKPVSK